MHRLNRVLFITGFLVLLIALPMMVFGQGVTTQVFAEAKIEANLRAAGDISGDIVGQIVNGTRYPVIGRNEFAVSTWYLLGDLTTGEPIGWVYFEVVDVYGDINSVPFSSVNVLAEPTATFTPPAPVVTTTPPAGETGTGAADANPPAAATQAPSFNVSGTVENDVNLRYGPGIDFPRVGIAQPGQTYEVIGYHTQFPWLLLRFPGAPNDEAWALAELVVVQGSVTSTRAITRTDYANLPTLTPTAAFVGQSSVPRDGTPVPLSTSFEALGNQLWDIVLSAEFNPITDRFGALYLHDLETGEEMTFGANYAFSASSVSKIGILLSLFQRLNDSPDAQMATDIANMMICSENVATNRLLEVLGGGDQYLGAEAVWQFFQQLQLRRTFLTAPFEIPGATAIPPSRPISIPQSDVDQDKANPDITNQMTVDEMGYVLTSLYQCAFEQGGPMLEGMDGFTPQECRKALHVMANNNVDALLRAGVPAEVPVAHKHGWIFDTHANAAVFFTPNRDYVMVMALHQPTWLAYPESLPVIAEVSRTVYNFYNPDFALPAIREGFIPETATCNYAGTPLVNDLMSPFYAESLPFDPLPLGETGG